MDKVKNSQNYLATFPLLVSFLLFLTVFQSDSSLTNGIVMGKVFWFSWTMLLSAAILLLYCFMYHKEYIHIHIPDILILLFYGITLLTYDWELQAEPEKLLFGGQLVLLWFMLRIFIEQYPSLKSVLLIFILYTGLIEAVWGIEQLYGYRMSHHASFRITGSFYNPGPYSGYLAAIMPIALSYILKIQKIREQRWWHYTRVIYYLAWTCLIAILLILPAGMSRTAWIATILSCGWVYWLQEVGWEKTKQCCLRYRNKILPLTVTGIICIIIISYCIFQLKKDSVYGRLLTWKITTQAIYKQPQGKGLGCFPAAYAEEQAGYFSSGNATSTEKLVAGCPEYAFNEYLQIGVEQGVLGLILFLGWLGSCIYYGIKNRRIGAVGGLFSILIFAFASYPLQLPSFWILLLFLSVICVAEPSSSYKNIHFKIKTSYLSIVIALLSFVLFYQQQSYYQAYKKWHRAEVSYNNKAYSVANPTYAELYPKLNHKPEYLFEYAQCMGNSGFHQEAITLLNRASLLSADPMIYYMIAKNKQALGEYIEAEESLLHAINILPERIYPYYLLTQLYSVPEFYQPDKLHAAIDSVLVKEPKVHTTAIQEMRDKVVLLLEKIETTPDTQTE